MISLILWIAGLVCCIWCIKDVWTKSHVDSLVKVLLTVGLLCFSWLGVAIYYFIIKDKI